uniref:Putative nucleolar serine-rich protein n=1 Tax=Aedes albopictus TaxID=7160 RepID=A0A1W7R5J2_AEDAL
MTLYWWKHWFWITVFAVVLIECTPLSSVDSYPVKLPSKLEETGNKSTYLKRANELGSSSSSSSSSGGTSSSSTSANTAGSKPAAGSSSFISSLPPMAAASSGLQSSSNGQPAPTMNSIAVLPEPMPQDVDDTFASGSLAGTDFGPDVTRFARTEEEGSASSTTTVTAPAVGSGRLKKNGTIFSRNDQNITTLKLKNYNRGVEKEELKTSLRMPDRGSRLVDTLMLTAVENSTEPMELTPDHPTAVEPEEGSGNDTDTNIPEDVPLENGTFSEQSNADSLQLPASSDIRNSSSSSSSISFSSSSSEDSNSSSSSERDIPDSHSDSSGTDSVIASDRRIGKILSSDFRDFVSNGNPNPNASSYISRAIAFSTQDLQEGIDDQDHPLEEDDYRRSSRSQQRLNVGAISGICLASLGLLTGLSAALIILYRRYLYLNKPQALSEPDSSGYIDDSTIRDNSDEMYSLDNDSFLNSLEAMTIQNYWTDNVKHTKL